MLPELQRVPGVGQAQLFGTERAMRIWIDPAKLRSFNLSAGDVNAAIRAQNAQVSSGTIGDLPNPVDQAISATVQVEGQLASIEQFGAIVLRANADGSSVRLRDVARIELGAQTYASTARLNGKPSAGIGIQLSPSGNALETAKLVRARMEELKRFFPQGMSYAVPYDTSRFVDISIGKVVETLIEAVVLVFLVMFLFLQNWRYTIIPTIVVPVALLGTFAVTVDGRPVADSAWTRRHAAGMVKALALAPDGTRVFVHRKVKAEFLKSDLSLGLAAIRAGAGRCPSPRRTWNGSRIAIPGRGWRRHVSRWRAPDRPDPTACSARQSALPSRNITNVQTFKLARRTHTWTPPRGARPSTPGISIRAPDGSSAKNCCKLIGRI